MEPCTAPVWHSIGSAGGMDLDQTLSSGQCFRWEKQEDGWHGIAAGRSVTARVDDAGQLCLFCPREEDGFWHHYFALDTDYAAIQDRFSASKRLTACVAAAPGLRVLNQPFFEVLCTLHHQPGTTTFPASGASWSGCACCAGSPVDGGGSAFPTPEALAAQTPETMAVLRAGWRSDYLLDAARRVCDGSLDPGLLASLKTQEARAVLMTTKGVGPKVADCVLLYGWALRTPAPWTSG